MATITSFASTAPLPTMPPMTYPLDLDQPIPLPPPELLPPPEVLATLPHGNAGPMLIAVIWALSAMALVFLSLRIYCKFLRHSGLWWDDYVLIASWVAITVECCILTYAAARLYYGVHIWDYPTDSMRRVVNLTLAVNVAGTFSLTAAIWSKTSFALTLLRLTEGWMKAVVWYIIISMNIAMGLSAVFIFVQCTPISHSWNHFSEGTCWPISVLINYDIFSAAYSAACDIALALMPWKLIWGLQMKKKEKIGVALAMSMGVFAGITAIVKTTKIPRMGSGDFYDGIDLFIWGNAESCVTIVAASIPVLRVMIREVRTSARRYNNDSNRTPGATLGNGTAASGSRTFRGNEKSLRSGTVATVVSTKSAIGGRVSRIVGSDNGNTDTDNTLTGSKADDHSEKSILDVESGYGNRQSPTHVTDANGRILRTDVIAVQYHERKDNESEYEMRKLR